MTHVLKKTAAGALAVSLAFATVACSKNEDKAADSSAASSTTQTTAPAFTYQPGADEMVDVVTITGETVQIPKSVQQYVESITDVDFGGILSVLPVADGALYVNYGFIDGVPYQVFYTPQNGPVLIHGAIMGAWLDAGAELAEVGLPLERAVSLGEGAGETQRFSNGTITATPNEAGVYVATIQVNPAPAPVDPNAPVAPEGSAPIDPVAPVDPAAPAQTPLEQLPPAGDGVAPAPAPAPAAPVAPVDPAAPAQTPLEQLPPAGPGVGNPAPAQ